MNDKNTQNTEKPIPLSQAEITICKIYLEDLGKYKSCNEYKLLQGLLDGKYIVKL